MIINISFSFNPMRKNKIINRNARINIGVESNVLGVAWEISGSPDGILPKINQ